MRTRTATPQDKQTKKNISDINLNYKYSELADQIKIFLNMFSFYFKNLFNNLISQTLSRFLKIIHFQTIFNNTVKNEEPFVRTKNKLLATA